MNPRRSGEEAGLAPAPRKPSERSWKALAVLGFGILSVLLLVATDQIRQRSQVRGLQYLQAVGEIQENVAVSHLWLEEYVSGDRIPVEDIFAPLDRSRELLDALRGKASEGEGSTLSPLPEPGLQALARPLEAYLAEFRGISEERFDGFLKGHEVGIGSPVDVHYDAVFRRLLSAATTLESALATRQREERRQTLMILAGLLLTWSLIVALSSFGLRTLERRRREAEAALRESQAQLFQTQKLDAVGRLAGGLAHDVSNYLAALRGHCELVRIKHGDDPWLSAKMDAAVGIVSKTSALLERLQTFRKKQTLSLAVLDLNRVVEGVQKVMEPSLREDVLVRTRLAPRPWLLEADPGHLEQLLVNLEINAQEAMGTGGTLTIGTRNVTSEDDGSEWVELTVEDNGSGISPDVRDRIFEPFFTTRSSSQRHGLGLAMVYSIVQQSGGQIQVESEVGVGTTFRIRFPRSLKPPSLVEAPEHMPDEALQGSEHVLLVDDNDAFRQATGELLEAFGYRVSAFSSGGEALEALPGLPSLNLVMTDVVMPGMSGPELVERLRHRSLPCLFLSGHADRIAHRHGLRQGLVHFLPKLTPARTLLANVRLLLDQERGKEASRPPPGFSAGDDPLRRRQAEAATGGVDADDPGTGSTQAAVGTEGQRG